MITVGLTHTSSVIVTSSLTAAHIGSGDLEVFATPAMTALMENAAMLAVAQCLDENCTTVGGSITTSHLRPTPVGAEVCATATLSKVEGRKLYFDIEARQGETVIGRGTHLRFIVNREKFMEQMR